MLTGNQGQFVPGEMLSVCVAIPAKDRERLPFSRIIGFGRVVRVERLSTASHARQRGLALAFCQDQLHLLGAMSEPVAPEVIKTRGAGR